MYKNKKQFSILLALVMVVTVLFSTFTDQALAEGTSKKITIVHVNDVHGRLELDEREGAIGFARFKTQLDQIRKDNPNTLLLNAGDTFHGTTLVNLNEGESMVELMNLLDFDVLAPGNHDFNYGYKRLVELADQAEFDVIASNIREEGKEEKLFKPYVIKEVDGIKIGIFGSTTEETKFKSHPKNTEGLEFLNTSEEAKKAVEAMKKEGVDLVVGLVHLGVEGTTETTAKDLLGAVDGIDLLIDGHSHEETNEKVGETLLVQAGSYVKNIGLVEIEVKDKKIEKLEAKLIPFEDVKDLEENEEVKLAIDKVKEANKEVTELVIGETKVDLNGERGFARTRETNLGNLIADTMREELDGDIALTNGGGIRASIFQGQVTKGDAITSFPFTNTLAAVELSGREVVAALEHGVRLYPEENGGFPQVSGLKFTFDASKEAGKRIDPKDVFVGDQAIDLDKKYKVVTNDFIATGGDGYEMFQGKSFLAEGGLYSDILMKKFAASKEIKPLVEGRINPINAPADKNVYVDINENVLVFTKDMGAPFIKEDRTLIPLRAISERLDHKVEWNGETRTVTIDGDVKLVIDNKTIDVKGEKLEMDVVPFIEEGRTYVPVRFVTEALGYKVDYNKETRTVLIKESKGEVLPAA